MLAVGSEIGALRRVEHVAAPAVAGAAGCRVPDRQEEAAAVLVQPPQRESPANRGGNRDPADLLKAGNAVRAGVDLEPLGLRRRLDGHYETQRRVVGPVRHASDPQRVAFGQRALRMRTHQPIAPPSPQRVRRSGIRLFPDACVQGGGRAAPVRELQGRYRVHDYDRTGAALTPR